MDNFNRIMKQINQKSEIFVISTQQMTSLPGRDIYEFQAYISQINHILPDFLLLYYQFNT